MVTFFIWWGRGSSTTLGRYRRARQMVWGVSMLSIALTALWVSGHRGYWFSTAVVLSLIAVVQVLLEVRRCRKLDAKGNER